MIIKSIQYNGTVQELEFDTKGSIIFFDGNPYFYDTKQTTIELTIKYPLQGVTNTSKVSSSYYSNEARNSNILPQLNFLKDNGYISNNIFNEISNIIYDIPMYKGTLPPTNVGENRKKLEIIGNGACGGIGNTLVTNLNDIWNSKGYINTVHVDYGETTFDDTAFRQFPPFFNIISKAIDENLIEVSDELKKFIEENTTVLPTSFSCKWDYYFNFSTEFLGRNVVNSVIVRWSCPAVNMGTEEFLKEHPDYKYSCALTKVVLEVSNTVQTNNVNWKTIYTGWYGMGEKELPFNMLQDNTAMTSISVNIGKILPFTDRGDVYLRAHLEFADGNWSSEVIGQCPYTSMSTDESRLTVYLPVPRDGSSLTLHYGEPTSGIDEEVASWNDDAKEPKIDDDFEDNDSDVDFNMDVGTNSNIGLLTKTYAITENQLQQIGNKIWSGYFTELIDALNSSPIENIISVKAFPFEITGGTTKEIMLGNVQMGVNGNELPSTYSPIKTIKSDFVITPRFSGLLKWLNYSPFTNIQMFLPYVGIVDINPQLVMGKKCTLKYIYDVILGNCQACLYVKDENNKSVEIGKWSGQLAIDIPITASNAVRMGVGQFTGTLDAISSFFHGDILGTIKDGIGVATQPFHSMTKGSPSSACDSFDMQNVYLIIDSPIYKYPSQFGHIYGYPCELYLHLNDLHGFVQCENVHIDGIPCMEEERVELLALLEEGVYL